MGRMDIVKAFLWLEHKCRKVLSATLETRRSVFAEGTSTLAWFPLAVSRDVSFVDDRLIKEAQRRAEDACEQLGKTLGIRSR